MREDVKRLVYEADKYKTQEELDNHLIQIIDLDMNPITEREIKTLKGNRIKAAKRRTVIVDE
jgi:hypothetical protein